MMRLLLLFLTLLCFRLPSQAQPRHFISLQYENDYFSETDRYYTQGIRLSYTAPFIRRSPISRLLLNSGDSSLNYYSLSAEQDGFTPKSIRHIGIYYGERPFAGLLFLSHSLLSINPQKKLRLITQLDAGLIGPEAMCEEEQKLIHRAIDGLQPIGWEHQVKTDLMLNYNLQLEKGLLLSRFASLSGLVEARLGTIYDDISAGLMMQTGLLAPYYKEASPSKSRKLVAYLFAKTKLKAVVYNASMQGGLFNRSSEYTISAPGINRLVNMSSAGIVISYRRLSIEYSKAWISPEFKGGLSHGWGRVNLVYGF